MRNIVHKIRPAAISGIVLIETLAGERRIVNGKLARSFIAKNDWAWQWDEANAPAWLWRAKAGVASGPVTYARVRYADEYGFGGQVYRGAFQSISATGTLEELREQFPEDEVIEDALPNRVFGLSHEALRNSAVREFMREQGIELPPAPEILPPGRRANNA